MISSLRPRPRAATVPLPWHCHWQWQWPGGGADSDFKFKFWDLESNLTRMPGGPGSRRLSASDGDTVTNLKTGRPLGSTGSASGAPAVTVPVERRQCQRSAGSASGAPALALTLVLCCK